MRVGYIAYWGLLEPLGRALILPAVRLFALKGVEVDLITFEKPGDLRDAGEFRRMTEELTRWGIRWYPLSYHKGPVVPAKIFDILCGVWVALRTSRPALFHARTFVGGVIGWAASRLRGLPFVFHNEGFWPDQQVEGGYWPANGWLYKSTKGIEHCLYRSADGLFLLSEHSRTVVEALLPVGRRTPIAIIPSATDLDRFQCPEDGPTGALMLAYIGNLGGRYPVEPLAAFLAALRRRTSSATLTALTLSGTDSLLGAVVARGLPPDCLRATTVSHAEVPRILCSSHAGLAFHRGGPGDKSGSSTKIGEYWAAGLPVVCSAGIGDAESVVRNERVGIVVEGPTDAEYDRAAGSLLDLLQEPGLRERCRAAARDHYSLETAVANQLALYRRVLEPR